MPSPRQVRVLDCGAVTSGRALSWDEGKKDMRDRLAHALPPGAKPVRHAVGSMRTEEARPGRAQCEQIVRTALEELRCPQALCLWALHGDTDNLHLHMMIVTVDPITASATPFGNRQGYKDAMQRAIARLDHDLGLQHEAGTLYEIRDGELVRKGAPPPRARHAPPIDQHILQWERASGLSSFTRMAQERASPILRKAKSWDEAHRAMAEVGMEIRPKSGGGEVFAGDEHVKLTRVGRDLTWKKLTHATRLGPYSPPPADLAVQPYEPRVDNPEQFRRWLDRREHRAQIAAGAKRRIQALQAARDRAIANAWAGSGDVLSMLPASTPPHVRAQINRTLRSARDEHIASLRCLFDGRIAAVRLLRDQAFDLPDDSGFSIAAFSAPDLIVTDASSDARSPPSPQPVAGYEARRIDSGVAYWSERQPRFAAFTDHGPFLAVNSMDSAAVEAVLTLAADRFGRIEITGTPEFIAESRRAAKKLGIAIDVVDQLSFQSSPQRKTKRGWQRLMTMLDRQPAQEPPAPERDQPPQSQEKAMSQKKDGLRHQIRRATRSRDGPKR